MPDEIEWRNVFSSVADRVGYNDEKDTLLVQWKNTGKVSEYFPNVPYKEFDELAKAPSVGQMLDQVIKPKYQHRYVKV